MSIQANIKMSLNGKPAELLIDKNMDLTTVSGKWLTHSEWILDEKRN